MDLEQAGVLVVDDEPALRDIFAGWLRRQGCRSVWTAADGEEGLAIFKENHIDLLITDIRMPRMDGITLVRRLTELGRPVPKIVFVSGFGDVDLREMYALGAEAFLPKPLSRQDLVEQATRSLIDRRDLWRTPMVMVPRQSLLVESAHFAPVSSSPLDGPLPSMGCVRLGRGGFAVRAPLPLTIGKLSFCCRFPAEGHEFSGQGYVRWQSRAEQTFGIEMAFLANEGRSWLLEKLALSQYHSFIPSFPSGRPEAVAS